MGQFNLDKILAPRAVAVVGASERPGSIGRAVLANILAAGFPGPVYPINPGRETILGVRAYPSLAAVGQPIDLAVIATAIAGAPELIAACGELGIFGVIVISGGGKEAGGSGVAIEERMLAAARPHGVRILGPNCLGALVGPARLNASFAHVMPPEGSLAFVSQSGATCTAVLDFAVTVGIGFSHFVSIGSMLDVDFGDLIDYLGDDPNTSAILLYMESVTNHRKFLSAARAVSRVKPIVALKVGRSAAGAKAAQSHTGAMAGEDAVFDEAFSRAGIVRVDTVGDLFDCAELMAKQPRPQGPNLAIISNAGGPAVMAADHLASHGIEPPQPSPATLAKLNEFLPPFWSQGNPLDILGDASPETFRRVAQVCLEAPEFDAILVLTTPQAQFPSLEKAEALCQALCQAEFPVFTCWLGGQEVAASRDFFRRAGIPTYDTPERAVQAFLYMLQYERNLEALQELPSNLPRQLIFDKEWAGAIIGQALSEGRGLLAETESKNLLESYGIPVTPTRRAPTAAEAAVQAAQMGFAVVLKLDSPDITHKSDAGGVALGLTSETEVRQAFERIMAGARAYDPAARLRGVTVQPMVRRQGLELILGVKQDPGFGPVILFGMGGVAAEVLGDRAIGLPPLNRLLARRMIERTKVSRLLKGYRNLPATDLTLLEEVLVRLSQLVVDHPEIIELDINPLLAHAQGCVALDARVVVAPAPVAAPLHLAISPYPAQFERHLTTSNGLKIFVRPIRPEDGPAMADLFKAFSPRTVFWRFGRVLTQMPPDLLARFTQVDYDREMALVVMAEGREDQELLAVGRVAGQPGLAQAELGLSVADAWQGRGIGQRLMASLVEVARGRGFARVVGMVNPANAVMVKLTQELGGSLEPLPDGWLRATIPLGNSAA
ncbi:MAG: GNAT family N-acetyltransferase [Pseudomonadota bacterium]